MDITQDIVEESEDERFDDVTDSNPWVELPPCETGRLEDINEVRPTTSTGRSSETGPGGASPFAPRETATLAPQSGAVPIFLAPPVTPEIPAIKNFRPSFEPQGNIFHASCAKFDVFCGGNYNSCRGSVCTAKKYNSRTTTWHNPHPPSPTHNPRNHHYKKFSPSANIAQTNDIQTQP